MSVSDDKLLTQQLDLLENQCNRMVSLLRDRQEGLSTWRSAVGSQARAINTLMIEMDMVPPHGN